MTILQNIIYPERGICTETDLYFRLFGPAAHDEPQSRLILTRGGRAAFDTWFNVFPVGKWQSRCGLVHLALSLRLRGRFALKAMIGFPGKSWEVLSSIVTESDGTHDCVFDLSHCAQMGQGGTVWFEITALEDVEFHGGHWLSDDAPRRDVTLGIAITTFRREAEVAETVRRLATFMETSAFGAALRLFVIDNGESAKVETGPRITYLPNANLGGAGGFSRGLQEVEAAGLSHCLFMDDDASFHMENIHRTMAFLSHALDDRSAVAGAMISNTHKWAMWENGATFWRHCRPIAGGTDLRHVPAMLGVTYDNPAERDENFYGGFWFFAFPVDHVTHRLFPFFVRGDDVNFSLANDFLPVTLAGVVSFQEDFTEKQSPLTHYLDLRSHLVHHLALERMELGASGLCAIAFRFVLRSLARMHYETAEAQLLAIEDVMEGPDFFAENADMSARRAQIRALTERETWELDASSVPDPRQRWLDRTWLTRQLAIFSVNGHFLPFFARWGGQMRLAAGQQNELHLLWGAAEARFVSRDGSRTYTVRHSKARFFELLWRAMRLGVRLVRLYPTLRDDYQRNYPRLTSRGFWQKQLAR